MSLVDLLNLIGISSYRHSISHITTEASLTTLGSSWFGSSFSQNSHHSLYWNIFFAFCQHTKKHIVRVCKVPFGLIMQNNQTFKILLSLEEFNTPFCTWSSGKRLSLTKISNKFWPNSKIKRCFIFETMFRILEINADANLARLNKVDGWMDVVRCINHVLIATNPFISNHSL